jgi:putative transcriptional regulator
MTIEEFKALLAAHGADRRRWPPLERAAAEILLSREPTAKALLEKAEREQENAEERADSAESRDFLTGQLLIAMPAMPDPRFAHSVIFMCMHDERGAMGLIVNQVVDGLGFDKLLEQVGIEDKPSKRQIAIHVGGPVETGRGFVLHSNDYGLESTLDVDGRIRLTQSIEVLKEISRGGGPRRCLLALGYAGWGPGQLEREIKQNGWLNVAADEELIFDDAVADKWKKALAKMGIDPTMLSSAAGRA